MTVRTSSPSRRDRALDPVAARMLGADRAHTCGNDTIVVEGAEKLCRQFAAGGYLDQVGHGRRAGEGDGVDADLAHVSDQTDGGAFGNRSGAPAHGQADDRRADRLEPARAFLGHNQPWRPTLSMQPPMQCVRRPPVTSGFASTEAQSGSQLTAPPPL
ncbi:MAG TPA: hypothetical protein VFA11_17575, partial [Acidimicrobiales bacterium]|nr:hypothetical protein [Acidimicrobiales bacterium]